MGIECRIHIEAKKSKSSKVKYKYYGDDYKLNSKTDIYNMLKKCNNKDAILFDDLTDDVKKLNLRNPSYMFVKVFNFDDIIANSINGWLIYSIGRKFNKWKYPDIRLIVEYY